MSIEVDKHDITGKHITVHSLDSDMLFSLPATLRGTDEPNELTILIYTFLSIEYDGWNAYTLGMNWIGCSEV
ncbi:hypothetical protein [Pseudoalteromonas luteoviolacea]|uniref:hypothetical protein n=1 Tax=Pseudoalteromonas luteoviolacea TaxID=43657 RepID=UPI001B393380|nr:hypothetical protein [Pseudoalteromonas luteoviolacea]MBQ4839806.1 hypothetical protein [Pseudoalteromonas luteoviolacea]